MTPPAGWQEPLRRLAEWVEAAGEVWDAGAWGERIAAWGVFTLIVSLPVTWALLCLAGPALATCALWTLRTVVALGS